MANSLKSVNPYNGEIIAEYPELNDEAVKESIQLSVERFIDYRNYSFEDKAIRMKQVSSLLKGKKDALARLITVEMGKPIKESIAEVEKCAWVCEYYAEKAEEFLSPRYIKTDADNSYVVYQPLGPVLAVMPWNFPFWQVFRFVAPVLMAGNTALLKHASNVQGCAQKIEELILEAGFEPGVFQNLAVSSAKVADIIQNPAVKAVTLTGSEPAGAAVAAIAGKNIKKSVLELGGNNAFVILEDADLELAVDFALKARLQNAGQSCIAAKRFIVENSLYEAFTVLISEKIKTLKIGDPLIEDTDIGPLSSPAQAEEVENQMQKSVKMGATLAYGGKRDKTIFEPAVLIDVKPGMPAFDEEVFGPVFAICPADTPKHALELANNSRFGLGINVFTASIKNADYFIQNADEGAVFINSMVKSDPRLPFGGIKYSGYGRELSSEGIREFVNTKTVYIQDL